MTNLFFKQIYAKQQNFTQLLVVLFETFRRFGAHTTQCKTVTSAAHYTVNILQSAHTTQWTYYKVHTLHSEHTTQWTHYTISTLHSCHTTQWTHYTVNTLHSAHSNQWKHYTAHSANTTQHTVQTLHSTQSKHYTAHSPNTTQHTVQTLHSTPCTDPSFRRLVHQRIHSSPGKIPDTEVVKQCLPQCMHRDLFNSVCMENWASQTQPSWALDGWRSF